MNNYKFIFTSFIILSNTDINSFIYPIYYNTEYLPENDDLLDDTTNEEEIENKEEKYDYYHSILIHIVILCWIIFFLSFTGIYISK